MLERLAKLIGDSDERAIKKLKPLVDRINELESEFEYLNDNQLSSKTGNLRSRLEKGENLNDLIPEAFAAVREASKRTLGQRHFDVQLMGGLVLHEGKIAEMKTGEGKTLVATLAAYLNALRGEGVHVVTVNDYLARRDAKWMGAIYDLLGLTTSTLQHESAYLYDPSQDDSTHGMEQLRKVNRREAYLADITYGTNHEFGFDYLRDNMVIDRSQRVQRQLQYAIVDEVDNILIDEARTPLIISGPAEESASEYYRFARLVPSLGETVDFVIDDKHRSVSLTGEGMSKVENLLRVKNLYDPDNLRLVHFVENALKARALFQKDEEYVVNDGEVVIVDEFTGRLMPGRRYSDGIHQALEAKEGLKIQRESITYATITLQNYFRMYDKLSGMTGTAATEAEEFFKIYKLEAVVIPTNMPMDRQDLTDLVYVDEDSKNKAVVNEIEQRFSTKQPVLVGTTDISKSEVLSQMLTRRGIDHEVLNAKHHEREASIVAQAGRPGAVTVATNMAGRGTDIVLGGNREMLEIDQKTWEIDHNKVVNLGGLHIIGTERHEARRIDNQLRGRAGRQGDAGSTRFYIALDDDLMRRFGGERIKTVMGWAGLDEGVPIENRMISKTIEGAQVKVEAYHFDMRKALVEYDDVVNTHRSIIYAEREKVLRGADLKTNIQSMVNEELSDILNRHIGTSHQENWNIEALIAELDAIFSPPIDLSQPNNLVDSNSEEIGKHIFSYADMLYEEQEESLTPELMRSLEHQVMLRVIDANWVQHLTSMENLRQGIGLHAYGQRDPLVMYKREGRDMFDTLLARIQYDIVHVIYHVKTPTPNARKVTGRRQLVGNESMMAQVPRQQSDETNQPNRSKVGRNAPCPCESGKKYKRCHGA